MDSGSCCPIDVMYYYDVEVMGLLGRAGGMSEGFGRKREIRWKKKKREE